MRKLNRDGPDPRSSEFTAENARGARSTWVERAHGTAVPLRTLRCQKEPISISSQAPSRTGSHWGSRLACGVVSVARP